MTFTYELVPHQDELVTRISEEVELKAVLHKPDEEPEEVVLVPTTTRTGPLTVRFSLDASELALSPTTTITADVYTTVETESTGPIFESFTQSLTIQSEGPLLEVDRNLGSTQRASFGELSYQQIGKFDYSVRLKADSPWGAITIGPPPPPALPPPSSPLTSPPLSSKILGPGEAIFPKLVDKIDVTFYYKLQSDRSLSHSGNQPWDAPREHRCASWSPLAVYDHDLCSYRQSDCTTGILSGQSASGGAL